MSVDRSMRNALAAILLVAALFVAMNQIVAKAPFADWWLPIVLFIVGAALAFAPSLGRRSSDEDEEAEPSESQVQTYLVEPSDRRVQIYRVEPQTPQLLTASPEVAADAEVLPFSESAPEAAAEAGDDDLTIISGIGAKSAEALKAAGIDSFQKLASSSEDALRAAISSAGVRLVGDVTTWAQQAAFAARGDWDGLSSFNAARRSADGD